MREDFLYDFKGGSLRSPPAARLRALASLASSPAARARWRVALVAIENDRLADQVDQFVQLRAAAR